MSSFSEKFEVEHHIAGPARRQFKTLVHARGYRMLPDGRVELTSPFGETTTWEFEGMGRGLESWLRCVS